MLMMPILHCVSNKQDTDVALYNFDADQTIVISFGRQVVDRTTHNEETTLLAAAAANNNNNSETYDASWLM